MAVKKQIKYKGISTLEVLEAARNYNKWIAEELLQYMVSPVIEIGAGIGNISSYFTAHDVTLTDVDEGLIKELKKRFASEKRFEVKKVDIGGIAPKSKYRTLVSVNVLEHLEDDMGALRNMNRLIEAGGRLVILVPASRRAYTRLDNELGHFRRYEKDELRQKILATGFKIERLYHFNILGLLSWIVRDKVSKRNINLKPYQVAVFDGIVPVLRKLESMITVPAGISLIVVAKKVDEK